MDLRKAIGDLLRATLSDIAGGWFSSDTSPAQDLKDAAQSLKEAGQGLRKGFGETREDARQNALAQLQAAGATQKEIAAILGPGTGVQPGAGAGAGGQGGQQAGKMAGMAAMLRGLKGAARGARVAGGGAGALFGGPVGAALAIIGGEIIMQFIERLVGAAKAVLQFSSSVEEGNRRIMSAYSPAGATAYAIRDMRQIMRDFQFAQATEDSAVGVVRAGERFRDSLQPHKVFWSKFGNTLAQGGYNIMSYFLTFGPGAAPLMVGDLLIESVNKIAELLGHEGELIEGLMDRVDEARRDQLRHEGVLQGGAAFHRELMSQQFRSSGVKREPLPPLGQMGPPNQGQP